jgi:hypothetical protein
MVARRSFGPNMSLVVMALVHGSVRPSASPWSARTLVSASLLIYARLHTWYSLHRFHFSLCLEYVWGVLDIFPDTDFPDVRHLSVMQSQIGSVLIVPRERGLIRLYVQLENHADLFDANGTIVREKLTADTILDVSRSNVIL